MRIYAKTVPIIVTIGSKIMIFCMNLKIMIPIIVLLIILKCKMQKNYCTKTINYSTNSNYYWYSFIMYSHNNLKSISFLG